MFFCDICHMTKTKVLHLSSERSWRGGEQQIAYLIEASVKLGVETAVLARKGSDFESWCRERKIELYTAGFKNGFDFSTVHELRKAVRRAGADIVHVHSGKSHSLAWLASLTGLDVPVVVHRRVDFKVSSSRLKAAKYNHSSVRRIICVSDAIADMVRAAVSRPERVVTVYSGIDFERFDGRPPKLSLRSEFSISADKLLVGNVSALAPHKDYETWLATAAKVLENRDDVHFFAVGSGSLDAKMKTLAKKLKIADRVTFTGFRKDVPDILNGLDVFLITSRTEGLGTGIIDAMYCGLPVTATRAGGIPELVVDGETGFLCNPGDVDLLASRLNVLLDDPELRKSFGDAGRARSLNFSKDQMALAVAGHYAEVLKGE